VGEQNCHENRHLHIKGVKTFFLYLLKNSLQIIVICDGFWAEEYQNGKIFVALHLFCFFFYLISFFHVFAERLRCFFPLPTPVTMTMRMYRMAERN